jgi:restriction system protein
MDTSEFTKALWPVFLILGVVFFLKIFVEFIFPTLIKDWKRGKKTKEGSKWRSDRELLTWLRGLTPKEFEEYIAELFERLGYKTLSVGGPNDGGIDVIAEKNGIKHFIQCKKYFKSHEVGVKEIRDFYGALADRIANGKAYFITTSKFTLPAERFAEDKPIELIDSYRLLEYIHLAKPKDKKEDSEDICPECGAKLVKRKGKYGDFLGCSNYPKCKYTRKL